MISHRFALIIGVSVELYQVPIAVCVNIYLITEHKRMKRVFNAVTWHRDWWHAAQIPFTANQSKNTIVEEISRRTKDTWRWGLDIQELQRNVFQCPLRLRFFLLSKCYSARSILSNPCSTKNKELGSAAWVISGLYTAFYLIRPTHAQRCFVWLVFNGTSTRSAGCVSITSKYTEVKLLNYYCGPLGGVTS